MSWQDDVSKKLFEDLLLKRVLYLEGEINSDKAAIIGQAIIWLNTLDSKGEITLYIDSGGGDALAGLDIYDIIRHSQAPVIGIVYRRAFSMAAVILQACEVRKAMEYSELALHDISVTRRLSELMEGKLEEVLKGTLQRQESIYEIFRHRSRLTIEEIKAFCKTYKSLSALEAKEFGLIDEII